MDTPTFKDLIQRDVKAVFLNPEEFADRRTVIYNGETYQDILISLEGPEESRRQQLRDDHASGLYLASAVLYCDIRDLDGHQPERGKSIRINDQEGRDGFFQTYFISSSSCEMGMLRMELEAIDE